MPIESGTLPVEEISRYVDAERRIIIRSGMSGPQTYEAIAIALYYAELGDPLATPANVRRAQLGGIAIMLEDVHSLTPAASAPVRR